MNDTDAEDLLTRLLAPATPEIARQRRIDAANEAIKVAQSVTATGSPERAILISRLHRLRKLEEQQ